MRLKCFIALAATTLCISALPAAAATVGPLSTAVTTLMATGDDASFTSNATTTSPFDKSWLFTISAAPALAFATGGNSAPSINPMTLAIYTDTGPVGWDAGDALINSVSGNAALSLFANLNSPGNYLVRIFGNFVASDSGSVAGTVAIIDRGGGPGDVPLPPALALFGTGLAGLTFFARRRKSKSTLAANIA